MLLRVFLILAILAGAGIIAVTHFLVKPHVQGIIEERNTNKANWDTELARANDLNKKLTATTAQLNETRQTLEQTQTELAATRTQADNEKKRADDLNQKLITTTEERNAAQQELAAWKALGIPIESIAALIRSEKELKTAVEILQEERNILLEANKKLQNRIKILVGDDPEIVLPAGLNGKVVAVDPKYDFVVLNIGEKQGVLENGIMLVSRDSKLIAKVKITSVMPDRSVANVMPGWKLDEVMEGDLVVY